MAITILGSANRMGACCRVGLPQTNPVTNCNIFAFAACNIHHWLKHSLNHRSGTKANTQKHKYQKYDKISAVWGKWWIWFTLFGQIKKKGKLVKSIACCVKCQPAANCRCQHMHTPRQTDPVTHTGTVNLCPGTRTYFAPKRCQAKFSRFRRAEWQDKGKGETFLIYVRYITRKTKL